MTIKLVKFMFLYALLWGAIFCLILFVQMAFVFKGHHENLGDVSRFYWFAAIMGGIIGATIGFVKKY